MKKGMQAGSSKDAGKHLLERFAERTDRLVADARSMPMLRDHDQLSEADFVTIQKQARQLSKVAADLVKAIDDELQGIPQSLSEFRHEKGPERPEKGER